MAHLQSGVVGQDLTAAPDSDAGEMDADAAANSCGPRGCAHHRHARCVRHLRRLRHALRPQPRHLNLRSATSHQCFEGTVLGMISPGAIHSLVCLCLSPCLVKLGAAFHRCCCFIRLPMPDVAALMRRDVHASFMKLSEIAYQPNQSRA